MNEELSTQTENATKKEALTVTRMGLEINENAVLNRLGFKELVNKGEAIGLKLGDLEEAKQIAFLYPDMGGTPDEVQKLAADMQRGKVDKTGFMYSQTNGTFNKLLDRIGESPRWTALANLTLEELVTSGKLTEQFPKLNDQAFIKHAAASANTFADLNNEHNFKFRPDTLLSIIGKVLTEEEKNQLQFAIADQMSDLNPLHVALINKSVDTKFYSVDHDGEQFIVRHKSDQSQLENQEIDIRAKQKNGEIYEADFRLQPDFKGRERESYIIKRRNYVLIGDSMEKKELVDTQTYALPFSTNSSE